MDGIQQLHRDLTVNNAEERCMLHIINVYMDRNTDYRTSSNEVRKQRTGPHFARFFLFTYFFTIYFPKKTFSNDQEVLYSNTKKVTFEEVKIPIQKEGARHE